MEEEEGVYMVEAILDKKMQEGVTMYRCRWKGYMSDDDTWEPAYNLRNCSELIQKYEESERGKHKGKELPSKRKHTALSPSLPPKHSSPVTSHPLNKHRKIIEEEQEEESDNEEKSNTEDEGEGEHEPSQGKPAKLSSPSPSKPKPPSLTPPNLHLNAHTNNINPTAAPPKSAEKAKAQPHSYPPILPAPSRSPLPHNTTSNHISLSPSPHNPSNNNNSKNNNRNNNSNSNNSNSNNKGDKNINNNNNNNNNNSDNINNSNSGKGQAVIKSVFSPIAKPSPISQSSPILFSNFSSKNNPNKPSTPSTPTNPTVPPTASTPPTPFSPITASKGGKAQSTPTNGLGGSNNSKGAVKNGGKKGMGSARDQSSKPSPSSYPPILPKLPSLHKPPPSNPKPPSSNPKPLIPQFKPPSSSPSLSSDFYSIDSDSDDSDSSIEYDGEVESNNKNKNNPSPHPSQHTPQQRIIDTSKYMEQVKEVVNNNAVFKLDARQLLLMQQRLSSLLSIVSEQLEEKLSRQLPPDDQSS